LTSLLDKKLVFISGKGGVGKTTIGAGLARMAAARGKRVLICEIDTDAYMGRLFGDATIGFAPTVVAPGIWACTLKGDDCMSAFVNRFVPGRVADLILRNKVAQIFFESAPSVMEAVIFDQISTHCANRTPGWDLILVDLPASGHAVTFLNVPRSMVEMVRVGELAAHMERVARLAADPNQSELILVSLPEEMSVNETLELLEKARARVATPVVRVVVNGVRHPDVTRADVAEIEAMAASADGEQRDVLDRLAYGARIGAFWREQDAEAVRRHKAAPRLQVAEIPFFFNKKNDTELVRTVANHLQATLGTP
jgi:arsenite/tail-anchored protein-transporting ATPase